MNEEKGGEGEEEEQRRKKGLRRRRDWKRVGMVWKGGERPGWGRRVEMGKRFREEVEEIGRGRRDGESKKFQNQKKDQDKR